ncbi:hypothetical protein ANN_03591 [Periplaneta americana]|uniref:Uncharacterized protein n=1 Tax=Periplaneta americana TaxID=6978 RepID=A0ABQ8U3R0_PERAM|nr:hypothetical protein ANN_03591 [Periplaneta americana]
MAGLCEGGNEAAYQAKSDEDMNNKIGQGKRAIRQLNTLMWNDKVSGDILQSVETKRLIWYGHLQRMSADRWPSTGLPGKKEKRKANEKMEQGGSGGYGLQGSTNGRLAKPEYLEVEKRETATDMDAPIPAPDACEVLSVKKFLNEQGIAPIEIDRQLCQVYGPNIMSKQMVQRSARVTCSSRVKAIDLLGRSVGSKCPLPREIKFNSKPFGASDFGN